MHQRNSCRRCVIGLRNALRLMEASEEINAAPTRAPLIKSPWSTGSLSTVPFLADIFGVEALPVSRSEAMSLPAIARGRHLLCSTIAKLPLKAYRGDQPLATQPPWLYRTNGQTSPQLRLAWTVDDLIFGGWSLWAIQRGEGGQILDAARCPAERWTFDADGQVLVDGQPVDSNSVILIGGLHEGILSFGARSVRAARALEEQVSQRAGNPTPSVELHQNTDVELTDDEIAALLDAWRIARSDPSGAVCYTPASVDVRVHGQTATDLLIESRNAAAIDMARLLGIPAAMIDASNVNSTLTYETLKGRNQEFNDHSVSLFTTPIAARLSMDDCTPRGTRIAFDLTDFTTTEPSPSGPALPD